MREKFASLIYDLMSKDKDVFFLTGDLGMFVLDKLKREFPSRFINCGASEQTMLDTAVGLTHAGKRVITYTITPFYYRAFETIRTYIDHEKLPVLMAGSGRDDDYKHDGYSHNATDFLIKMNTNTNIIQYYPTTLKELSTNITQWYNSPEPTFLSLKK